MTTAQLQALLRRLTNTNSTSYSDADTLVDLNNAQREVVTEILLAIKDKNYQGEVYNFNLVDNAGLSEGNNGYEGSYAFPSDLLRPVRIELKLDGTNWRPAKIYDINENPRTEIADEDDVNASFSESSPYVRFWENKMYIRPMPDAAITNGGRLWYEERHSNLSTEDSVPAFEELFHQILAYKSAIAYNTIWGRSITNLKLKEEEIKKQMIDFYREQLKMEDKLVLEPDFENYE